MTRYNSAAGRSTARLAALSDGVFSIAMTLLVLELQAPAAEAIHSDAGLAAALLAIAPKLLIWAMSFLTLGIFWVAQTTLTEALVASDRDLSWLNLALLAVLTLLPFTTALLGEFTGFRLALLAYWLNLLLPGLLVLGCWRYAHRHHLIGEAAIAQLPAIERRVVRAQAAYFLGLAVGMAAPVAGIAVIFLVQLNYAVAPRWGHWLG